MPSSIGKKVTAALTKSFEKRDINKDGVLTGTEIKKIERYDADKDGKITKEEFDAGLKADKQAAAEKKAKIDFGKLDKNKDGVLTGDEAKRYGKFDIDKDGKVSLPEFISGRSGKPLEDIPSGGGSSEPPKPAEGPASTKGKFKTFEKRDGNNDGVLTGNELEGLTNYDLDGNREVSKEEFVKARRQELGAQREARRNKEFDKLDITGEGELTGTEVAKIKRYDTDGDGKVSRTEFHEGKKADWRKKIEKQADELFKKADINEDEVLTGNEYEKRKHYDSNQDGKIDQQEFRDGYKADRAKAAEAKILG